MERAAEKKFRGPVNSIDGAKSRCLLILLDFCSFFVQPTRHLLLLMAVTLTAGARLKTQQLAMFSYSVWTD
jgi:hypothetical protein